MVGTEYFDKQFGITPMDVENSEWVHFNYKSLVDINNKIEIDNMRNEEIRYLGEYLPKYVKPDKPPSRKVLLLTKSNLRDQLPIVEPFKPKFTGAITENLNIENPFERYWDNI